MFRRLVFAILLCWASVAWPQELPENVTLTVEAFPPCAVSLETTQGPVLLGNSGSPLELKPPCVRDGQGRRAQYATGRLILQAPGHADFYEVVPSQNWSKGRLPIAGRYHLTPNNVWVGFQDYFTAYPFFISVGLVGALGALMQAYLWQRQARRGKEGIQRLARQLETSSDPLLGRKLGAYEVQSRLGQGGMGSVYRVVNEKGEEYAAKVVYFEDGEGPSINRFRREFKVLRNLQHPGLVKFYDYGEGQGMAYGIMELVHGQTLDAFVTPGGLPWSQVWPWFRALLEGLAYAHEHGVVHRDLKPSNIMIDKENLKILDFGLARQADIAAVTMTGDALGTPVYIAPEQISSSSSEIDPRTDIYSLGIILFELLAGHPPFHSEEFQEILAMHALKPPPPISRLVPTVPTGMDEVLLTMLAKQPVNRYANIGKLLEALSELELRPLAEPLEGDPSPGRGAPSRAATINLRKKPPR